MTRRERVTAALNHRETDFIPYSATYTHQFQAMLEEYAHDPDITQKLGSHIDFIEYWGWPTPIEGRPEFYKDDFGVVWNRSGVDKDIGVIEGCVVEDLEDYHYKFPKLDEARLRKEYEDLVAGKEDKFCMASLGFLMFERSWTLMGMENVLMSMIATPKELERFFDEICDYHLRIVDIALEYDLDGIFFGDDWGQQVGLIMGPEHWRHYIKPRMKRLYDRAKSKGKFVFQHSCGDIHELFPDLIEMGLDCYQTFQPEIYDIEKIKREYGNDLSFWGGISTQKLLPYATPDEVKRVTAQTLKIMGKGGGYIAGPTHDVAFDVPPENILAMFEVFHNQEKYL